MLLRGNCRITLTDLPSASEISHRNIECQERADTAEFCVLDWDSGELPGDISSRHFDVVLVADCMYNCDAAPALVSVIAKVVRPDTVLVVAHKRRHESEDRFLELLLDGGGDMVCEDRTRVNIGEEAAELESGGVDLYAIVRPRQRVMAHP